MIKLENGFEIRGKAARKIKKFMKNAEIGDNCIIESLIVCKHYNRFLNKDYTTVTICGDTLLVRA